MGTFTKSLMCLALGATAVVAVPYAIKWFANNPNRFLVTRHLTLVVGDYGDLVMAVEEASLAGVRIQLREGSYECDVADGSKVRLKLGPDVLLLSDGVVVAPETGGHEGKTNTILLGVQEADFKIEGEMEVTYGDYPPVTMTSVQAGLTANDGEENGEAELSANLMATRLIGSLLTYTLGLPAVDEQETSRLKDNPTAILRTVKIDSALLKFSPTAEVTFEKCLSGKLGEGCEAQLTKVVAGFEQDHRTFAADARLALSLADGSTFSFDKYRATAKSVALSINGALSHNEGGTTFTAQDASDSTFVMTGASIDAAAGKTSRSLDAPLLEASLKSLSYKRPAGNADAMCDYAATATGVLGLDIRTIKSGAIRTMSVGSVILDNFLFSAESGADGEVSQTVESTSPIELKDIRIGHDAKDATMSVAIPYFRVETLAKKSPSSLLLDLNAALPSATSIAVAQKASGDTFEVEFEEGFKLQAKGAKAGGDDSIDFESILARGVAKRVAYTKKDGDSVTLSDAKLDLKAACGEGVALSGSLSGGASVDTDAFALPNAAVSMSTAGLTLSKSGNLESGEVVLTVSLSASDFKKLVRSKIPSRMPMEDMTVKFNVVKKVQEALGRVGRDLGIHFVQFKVPTKIPSVQDIKDEMERVPENTQKAGEAIQETGKEALRWVEKSTTVSATAKNITITPHVSGVSLVGRKLNITGRPSVSGTFEGPHPISFGATFNLDASISIAFSEPKTLCELELLAAPTYNKVTVELASTLKKVPGAKEAKDMLVEALTGGEGLKKYFPEDFNRRLIDCEKVESDPFLKRISNPRVVLKEKDGAVFLMIAGTYNSAA